MELYHLRSFVTVAEERHLTRAAQRLFTSQPAVSAHIKTLEEELGVSLFCRTSKGMELTQEGQMLRTHAEHCLMSVNEFFHQAKRLQDDLVGIVKVSLHASPDLLKIGNFFSVLNTKYPNVECHLLQKNTWEIPDLLRKGELDAGYLYGNIPDSDIAVRLLRTCKLMIIGPPQWEERLENANLAELVELPWIGTSECCPFHQATFDIFQVRNLQISSTIAVVDQESTILNLVSSGIGLALMVDEDAIAAEKAGKAIVWKDETFTIDLCMAYLQQREQEPLIQAVLNSIFTVWGTVDQEFAVHPSL